MKEKYPKAGRNIHRHFFNGEFSGARPVSCHEKNVCGRAGLWHDSLWLTMVYQILSHCWFLLRNAFF
jgi:hypothetical protein